ncbi:MAG: type II toxin-antitoxin system VapC family toxin [Spirochaetota bacterium]|nr:type II toxin-antitoxin system VapC family toxin [Spirochaetota bacterium]
MKYYLDTNICIYYLKGINANIGRKLFEKHPDDIKIASIVKAELLYGAEKSIRKEENLQKIEEFLFPFEIMPFGNRECNAYARIRADMEKEGEIIGPNDVVIAAVVLENDGTLVTNNEREFARIENLKIENWAN